MQVKKHFLNSNLYENQFIRHYFTNVKFNYNIDNGLIDCNYQIKSETWHNNQWIETI